MHSVCASSHGLHAGCTAGSRPQAQGCAVTAAARSRHPRPSRQRVYSQVATTETVTREAPPQQQPKESSWSWGRVLNPFQRKQQQAPQLETINEAELWQLLEAEQQVPLVVIFSATWCGPCKIMVQRLESLIKELGPAGIKAVKIDTDECGELATELKVHKLPTLFFVGPDPSKPAAHYTGLLPEAVMRDMVQNRRQYLGTDIRRALSI